MREEQRLAAAFTLCALSLVRLGGCEGGGADVAASKQRDGRWPLGVTEKVRGLQGTSPGFCVQRIFRMATACLIFLGGGWEGCHLCFSNHVTSDKIRPLVQSFKLCQKANSSPPWGLALNLPGLSMSCGTHKEAICDSPRVPSEPASHAENCWCFPPGLHSFLFICEPFCFCF